MAIKAVIFDCFGVLATSAREALVNKYPQFKTQIDDIMHQADYGLLSTHQQLSRMLMDLLGASSKEVESYFWDVSVRDEVVINWVKGLKSLGEYKIGLLSNVGPQLFEKFFDLDEQKRLFDQVILSSDVGMAKPDVAIFELIAKKLGVKPSECVMIDDTPLNVEAAVNAGMQGIQYISLGQARDELNKLLELDRA
jgi:HAD superfamily hydrolase (TIGR01549 family)